MSNDQPFFPHSGPSAEANVGIWIEDQCRALGVSVASVAREASIDRTTIFRWKKGDAEPYWKSFQRVKGVIDSIWGEREDKAG